MKVKIYSLKPLVIFINISSKFLERLETPSLVSIFIHHIPSSALSINTIASVVISIVAIGVRKFSNLMLSFHGLGGDVIFRQKVNEVLFVLEQVRHVGPILEVGRISKLLGQEGTSLLQSDLDATDLVGRQRLGEDFVEGLFHRHANILASPLQMYNSKNCVSC